MGAGNRGQVEFLPVGDTLYNGMDLGGARIYPFSMGLAITPPAEYSNYIGSASGPIVVPPVAALEGTTGSPVGGGTAASQHAVGSPWGRYSPLPWVVAGLVFAILVMWHLHYRK